MKIAEIPITQNPMTISLTLKGVTHLTQGRYKQRHGGSKDILQQPVKGFITRKQYFIENPHEKRKPSKPRPRPAAAAAGTAGSVSPYGLPPVETYGFELPFSNGGNLNPIDFSAKSNSTDTPTRQKTYKINRKEVTHRILNYVNQMKGEKLLFLWTVSFPLKTPDQVCYRLLNTWLTRLRQEKMIKDYLWISERQQNGTLHYHIAVNNRMCVKRANKMMRASIMHCINKKLIEWNRTDAAKYNGVDISKNRKTKRVTNFALQKNQKALSNYLTKYISKSDNTFTQLAWHNSRGYSNLIIKVNMTAAEFFASPLRLHVDIDTGFEGEFFVHFRWKGSPPKSLVDYLAFVNSHILDLIEGDKVR